MDKQTLVQRRVKVVSDANEALELARDGARDAADKLADLVGHDATIAKAKDLAQRIDDLRTDMAGRELLVQIENEAMRREAHAAAEQNRREDEAIERLDDCLSDYVEDREAD